MSQLTSFPQLFPPGANPTAFLDVDQTGTGCSVKVACDQFPVGEVGNIQVVAIYPGNQEQIQYQSGLAGGGLDKFGNPLLFVGAEVSWPGHANSEGVRVLDRPLAVRVILNNTVPVVSSIELNTGVGVAVVVIP